MSILTAINRHGMRGTAARAVHVLGRKSGYYALRFRRAPEYRNPTPEELIRIEDDLSALDVPVQDYYADSVRFRAFQSAYPFPADYHGGRASGVWDEKLLEHFVAFELLNLEGFSQDDIYIDVAACSSPWARMLRSKGLNAYAIDLEIADDYKNLSYYRRENATATAFAAASVMGASLRCAFEMFLGQDDTNFMREATRILAPGGKIVILPLYMHTHYCAYSTPDYWGKGFSDPDAQEYIRFDCLKVPSSRKYDAAALKRRVLEPAINQGLRYRLLALRNKADLGTNIYCHFILEIFR